PEGRTQLIECNRAHGRVDGARARWRTRTGATVIVQIYGHVVENGLEPSFDASIIDVTASEAQRADLERTALILDRVVHQMPALYWVVDLDQRIVQVGGAVETVLGYAKDRFLHQTVAAVHAHEPGSVDPVEIHRQALAGATGTYLSTYRGKHLSNTVAPLRSNGAIVGAIGTGLDITLTHALEARMVDAQRAESLGVLAGGLAHDFNNLLVAILGNADLALRDIPAGTPGRANLENIRSTGMRAAELTDQLLSYAGRGGLSLTRLAPGPIVDELLRIFSPSMPSSVQVSVDIPHDLVLRGDPSQVRQILLNLIGNARDALGHRGGSIRMTGRIVRHDGAAHADDVVTASAGTYALLEISDDGPGIDRDNRRRIFEPFFTTKASGNGLGLAAVVGIVRSHLGGLRLVSAPGEGARFEVMLPSTVTPVQQAAVNVAVAGRTVLVIDDEDIVRDVVARMIEELGYTAITAADGQAGLAIVERHTIDLVLVDLSMPTMSGADVIAVLRERRPSLPIILCSGYDRARKGIIQADAYLPKPFRLDALEHTLAKILGPAQ
nr:response regulator [Deltaproteobacteria bacterium]